MTKLVVLGAFIVGLMLGTTAAPFVPYSTIGKDARPEISALLIAHHKRRRWNEMYDGAKCNDGGSVTWWPARRLNQNSTCVDGVWVDDCLLYGGFNPPTHLGHSPCGEAFGWKDASSDEEKP